MLELPGTSDASVSFGPATPTATISAGTFAFDDVTFAGTLPGYSATTDAATGPQAMTFLGDTTIFNSSNWSDSANSSNGIPVDGSAAIVGYGGSDDIVEDAAQRWA